MTPFFDPFRLVGRGDFRYSAETELRIEAGMPAERGYSGDKETSGNRRSPRRLRMVGPYRAAGGTNLYSNGADRRNRVESGRHLLLGLP